jgi:hypothetical protein
MSTPRDPKAELVDAIQDYISEHETPPQKATIPHDLALEFCKLGRNELGDLSQELMVKGPSALNGKILFGVEITVPAIKENVDYIELE